MRVLFRTDASLLIGSGHVVRCITLAESLTRNGAQCSFFVREHAGHHAGLIHAAGFSVDFIGAVSPEEAGLDTSLRHAPWVGASWTRDAEEFLRAAGTAFSDWVVVDHYGLDRRWEQAVTAATRRVLVIDDLEDRPHRCDILLDQNVGRTGEAYARLVGSSTRRLLGPRYALIAPSFLQWRKPALVRRDRETAPSRLLISMGGVDRANLTERVLNVLDSEGEAVHEAIDVVLGKYAPHIDRVRARIATMRTSTRLHVDTRFMGQLLCDADLAIGAGGISALERCVLGLPTISIAAADNQVPGLLALAREGAACYVGGEHQMEKPLIEAWRRLQFANARRAMARRASEVCDGKGVSRVVSEMLGNV